MEILTSQALTKVWQNANLFSEREHITLYVPNHPELFHIRHLKNGEDLSAKRWTLDYHEDYELVSIIFQNVYRANPDFRMTDVVDFLSSKPELESINAHIRVDAGVLRSMRQDWSVVSVQ